MGNFDWEYVALVLADFHRTATWLGRLSGQELTSRSISLKLEKSYRLAYQLDSGPVQFLRPSWVFLEFRGCKQDFSKLLPLSCGEASNCVKWWTMVSHVISMIVLMKCLKFLGECSHRPARTHPGWYHRDWLWYCDQPQRLACWSLRWLGMWRGMFLGDDCIQWCTMYTVHLQVSLCKCVYSAQFGQSQRGRETKKRYLDMEPSASCSWVDFLQELRLGSMSSMTSLAWGAESFTQESISQPQPARFSWESTANSGKRSQKTKWCSSTMANPAPSLATGQTKEVHSLPCSRHEVETFEIGSERERESIGCVHIGAANETLPNFVYSEWTNYSQY